MACSEECFREYMRRIEASRKPAETDEEVKEEMTAQVSDENHVKSLEDPECRKF